MKKQIVFSIVLAYCIVILNVTGFASVVASGICEENSNASWELDENGTFTIRGTGDVELLPVEGVENALGLRKESIKKVIIEGISRIKSLTLLKDCGIDAIYISGSVKEIGNSAFSHRFIQDIYFSNGLVSIGNYAFSYAGIKEIVIPETVKEIGTGAFNWGEYENYTPEVVIGGKAIILSKDVQIGDYAFGYYDHEYGFNMEQCGEPFYGPTDPFADYIIYGYKGSTAEEYAIKNGIHFEELTDEQVAYYKQKINTQNITNETEEKHPNASEKSNTDASEDNKISQYTGDFTFASLNDQNRTYQVVYDDAYFANSGYNHSLARASLSMAMAAYNNPAGSFFDIPWDKMSDANRKKSKPANIYDFLTKCGFSDTYVNEGYLKKPQDNSIGVAFAHKPLGSDTTLIAIVVRGGGYESEWAGNFNVYNSKTHHQGFLIAQQTVIQEFQKYISTYNIKGKVKFWITGYSRGGGVANLSAANLIDNHWPALSYSNSDVFAYTFEAPRNTKDKAAKSDKYNSIFNIVNPIDPVPMVAMEKWGYQRYGNDYYLPSEETTSKYKQWSLVANNHYTSVSGYTHVYLPHVAGQQYLLQEVIDLIAGVAKSDSSDVTAVIVNYLKEFSTSKYKNPAKDVANEIILEMLKYPIRAKLSGLSRTKKILAWMVDEIAQAHYSELTLAWMWAVDGFDGKEPYFRIIQTNCPVDVEVFDASDNLVAKIKDDKPVSISGSSISAFIDFDGQKIVILPSDEDYSVKLTATGDGEMNYSVSDYNAAANTREHVVNYYDIAIKKGDVFEDQVQKADDSNITEDKLKDSAGKEITPDEELSGNKIVLYKVDVKAEGGGSAGGGGVRAKGEFVNIEAVPAAGNIFAGWYYGKTIVSDSAEYRFAVKSDITLTAKFISEKNGTKFTDPNTSYKYVVTKARKEAAFAGVSASKKNISIPATVRLGGRSYKVTSIANNALKKDKKLVTVSIGANVKKIGKNAFTGCVKLKKVTGCKAVTSIGANAFSGDRKLTSVPMSAKLTSIGDKAFYMCTALTKVTIPAKVTKIGKSAFQGCKKLKTITIKSIKLTAKKVGAKAFTGTPANATVKVPKKSLKSYRKWLVKKGINKKVKIKN